MNERIKDLASKAGWGITSNPYKRQAFDVNMFAELIIRECANRCEQSHYPHPNYSVAIKKHFGIEDE